MDNRKGLLSCSEAKQKDLVDYLSGLGHDPSKISGKNYWYLSPLRTEKTASFKVDRKLNCWYDHGLGKGGNLIDFGIIYHQCSVKQFLEKFTASFSPHRQPFTVGKINEDPALKIISVNRITSLVLFRYLDQRRIDISVAEKYCKEVIFTINKKEFTAIGFSNDKGGFELRNSWFKGSSSPKTITSFKNGSKHLSVFEGFFNFLSFLGIQNLQSNGMDFLVLNSVSFFNASRPLMEQYEYIHLYLDRDRTGQNFTRLAQSINNKYQDESRLYNGYKDINAWIMHIGNPH